MEDPTTWAVIWLGVTAVFGLGEMAAPGSFFLAPFGIGALAAAIVSMFQAPIAFAFILFIVVSIIAFLLLRPLAARLDSTVPLKGGVGAHRLIGQLATVIEPISNIAGHTGMVKTGGETWRADGDGQTAFGQNEQVRILEVRGTSLIVTHANNNL